MNVIRDMRLDVLHVTDVLWVLHAPTGIPAYDFALDRHLECRRPFHRPDRITVVARFGAIPDYPNTFQTLHDEGIDLVHDQVQHRRASELPEWYPLLVDLTPRSVWYDSPPTAIEIEQHFNWPVFIKGSRQTNRHRADLAIARSADDFERIMTAYRTDPILSWQSVVCRELVDLRRVAGDTGNKVPPAFEFRTFWWYGELVGNGAYWSEFCHYSWNDAEREAGLAIARRAAQLVNVPFLVVDIAQLVSGEWIVIECNDGQESGYAGVSPFALWNQIIERERIKIR